MAGDGIQRRLAAILAADVVGYSRLMDEDEACTFSRLLDFRREVFEPKARQFNGRIFKTTGDGALVEFQSAVDAVNGAIDVQRAMVERNDGVPQSRRISLRIGISLGDVMVEGGDLYGNGVNIAARMEGLADAGGICVSGNVYEHVRGAVGHVFDDLGERPVKNIDRPVRCYRVRIERPGEAILSEATATILRQPAIAVLPFTNMSGDREQDYFADGLTEDIITALTTWRSFPVIARNSTFTFKGRAVKVQDVARELGARYVVEGSVRKSGQRVRVTAQLIDAETGHHAWAERYDRDIEDIFALQDEITRQVVATLMPELERAEYDRSATKSPTSLDAWDCYLRGASYLNELAPENIFKARAMLERAIAIDPTYAKAHSRLGLSYHRELWLYVAEDRDEAARRLMEAAVRAVALDDADSASHWVLAVANFWPPLGDKDVAVREVGRALALNPADVDANFTCGTSLLHAGRGAEAVPHLETALRISPRDPMRSMFLINLAYAYFLARRMAEAERTAREILETGAPQGLPEQLRIYVNTILVSALGHLGRANDARALIDRFGAVEIASGATTVQSRLFFAAITDADRAFLFDGLRKAGIPD